MTTRLAKFVLLILMCSAVSALLILSVQYSGAAVENGRDACTSTVTQTATSPLSMANRAGSAGIGLSTEGSRLAQSNGMLAQPLQQVTPGPEPGEADMGKNGKCKKNGIGNGGDEKEAEGEEGEAGGKDKEGGPSFDRLWDAPNLS
jgi:hypothetical protein